MNRSIVFIVGMLIGTSTAFSQQKMPLTIEKAIEIGLENSKTLRTSQYRMDAADAKASEAYTYGLPSFKFSGTYTRLSDVPAGALPANSFGPGVPAQDIVLLPAITNNYGLKASVQQPLFTGGKISGAADAAGHLSEATQKDYLKDKADVLYTIKAVYWNLYRANEFKRFTDENVNQIRSHAKDAENLMNQGMLTANDLMKVQVLLSDALVRQIDAENNVKLAMYALNNTLGLPLQTELVLESVIQVSDRAWSPVDSLVLMAFDRRPDMLAMHARVKAGESGLTSARGGWWPQVYLIGNYNYLRPNSRYFPAPDAFKETWDVTLSLSFDIWNWWQTGYQANQAQAQLAQVEEGLSMLKDGVMLDVTQSYLGVNQAKDRKGVAEQGVKQAEENYRVVSGKYKNGLASNLELQDAEVSLLQARLNLTQSLVDYELSMARLSRAIGE